MSCVFEFSDSFVNGFTALLVVKEIDTCWHLELPSNLPRLPVKQLLHSFIEIYAICDLEHMPNVIDHSHTVLLTEGLKAHLISLKSLLTLGVEVHVLGDFLDYNVSFVGVGAEVVEKADREAGDLWAVAEHGLDDWLGEELDAQVIKEESESASALAGS